MNRSRDMHRSDPLEQTDEDHDFREVDLDGYVDTAQDEARYDRSRDQLSDQLERVLGVGRQYGDAL